MRRTVRRPTRRDFLTSAGAFAVAAAFVRCRGGAIPLVGAPPDMRRGDGGVLATDLAAPATDFAGPSVAPYDLPPACGGGLRAPAGPASSYAVGKPPVLVDKCAIETLWFFVVRDAGGLYATGAVCTRVACVLVASATGFQCPCEGATWDLNGGNLRAGYAPLPHYALDVDAAGNVSVDPTVVVDPATRV